MILSSGCKFILEFCMLLAGKEAQEASAKAEELETVKASSADLEEKLKDTEAAFHHLSQRRPRLAREALSPCGSSRGARTARYETSRGSYAAWSSG